VEGSVEFVDDATVVETAETVAASWTEVTRRQFRVELGFRNERVRALEAVADRIRRTMPPIAKRGDDFELALRQFAGQIGF
jgi:hypothetical protein